MPDIISSKPVYRTPWFDVLEDSVRGDKGEESSYYTVSSGDGCFIFALTETRGVLMVMQFRPALRRFTLEMPAGGVDPGEAPLDAARRELLEETGHVPRTIVPIGSGNLMMNRFSGTMHGFLALDCVPEALDLKESESELVELPWFDFCDLVRRGDFIQIGGLGFIMLAKLRGLLPSWMFSDND